MRLLGLACSLFILGVAVICSVIYGVTDIPLSSIWESFVHYDYSSQEHLIIQTVRVPRALIAVAAGASLAVAGALMQVITRNPIASPSLFGINSGAAFMVVIASGWLGVSGMQSLTLFALLGAAISGSIVFYLGSIGRDGMTPIKITLAGASIAAFFHSMTQGYMLTNGKMFDQVLVWLVGSVAGRDMSMLINVLPYLFIGFIIAVSLSRHLNVLLMGDDVAQTLGQRTATIKSLASVAVILLAGGSVAVAGPIAFVGIIIPHIVRYLVGNDYRRVIPYSAVLGGILLVTADIGARYIAMPKEIPVGVMTAILGVPFFIYIARKGKRVQ
ncbi:FecCD family ABC transporter permease [Paenibacillus glacialis]|uniref:Iron ABC transporter n=1 Tax=Paenibacillus glacialis TaxID=494026 RepID=A0A168M902_9BACL|nr:iron ABC transporter permease [Paenibacillus glacialis]OAB44384.1 iron ABC transporter [Paenibacillus glacialis]